MLVGTIDVAVIDTDTHLTEPPDLWTSRLPQKWQQDCPRVEFDAELGIPRWKIGGNWGSGVGTMSHAGWKDFTPSYPPTFEDIAVACHDADARVEWMDTYGIAAQVLYPNVAAFEGYAIMKLQDPELRIAIIRAYNDYQVEFSTSHTDRFVLIATLPFWDVDASIQEMERCAGLGFKGILWAATLDRHGLPATTDPAWDPLYARAQDLEMSVNLHVGVGITEEETKFFQRRDGEAFDYGVWSGKVALTFLSNANTITNLIMSGLCARFPRLKFVSVESGFGFVPFLLEALDWQWASVNGSAHHPDRMLPSEYFRRQIYTTFWFEQASLPLLPLYADNVMFETDFPHSTSLSPGPGSPSPAPDELMRKAIEIVGEDVMRKVLSENARALYRV